MTITAITQELVAEIHLSYPTLNALNLSDNEICEIENLGPLQHLATVDLSGNVIETLRGVDGEQLTSLRELNVSGNRVSRVVCPPCGVELLDLGENKIAEWSQVDAIGASFPRLRELVLCGNPVAEGSQYRARVVRAIPTLQALDRVPVTDAERAPPVPKLPASRPVVGPGAPTEATSPRPRTSSTTGGGTGSADPDTQHALEARIGALEADNYQLRQQAGDCQIQGDASEERATDLMIENVQLKAQLQDSKRDRETDALKKSKLDKLDTALRETTSKLEHCASDNEALQAQLRRTEQDVVSARGHLDREQQAHLVSEELVQQLRRDLAVAKAELQEQAQSMESSASLEIAGRKALALKLKKMEDANQESTACISNMESERDTLLDNLGNQNQATQDAQRQIDTLSDEVYSLRSTQNSITSEIESKHEKIAEQGSEVEVLRQQLSDAATKSASVHSDLQTTQTSLEHAEQALIRSRDSAIEAASLEGENRVLREQLSESEAKAVQVGQMLCLTQQSLGAISAQI